MNYTHLVKAIDAASMHLLGRAAAVVNQSLVIRNWIVGAYIVEFEQNGGDRAKYGARLLECLGNDLTARLGKGFIPKMLERMRRLYQVYPQIGTAIPTSLMSVFHLALPSISTSAMSKLLPLPDPALAPVAVSVTRKSAGNITPLSANAVLRFSWTQLIELIRLDDPLKRAFYENECLKGNWSVRQLQRQIGSLLYERTGLSTNKAAVLRRAQRQEPQEAIADLIRDPYVLEFTGLAELPAYQESDLERALLNHLQTFLLELGTGFCFEARQKRITVSTRHDYIDLVFYQRRLRCHVLLDLKVRPFEHGDAGQMNFYLNWWRKHGMGEGDRPPVGIVLCSDREKAEVEFATAGLSNKLFVSRYLVVLPSADQLRAFLERDRAQVESLIVLPPAGAKARPITPRFALPEPSPGRPARARPRRLRRED